MPWHVGKKNKKGWPILRSDTGEIVGYSKSKWKAEASVRIRYEKTYGHTPKSDSGLAINPHQQTGLPIEGT